MNSQARRRAAFVAVGLMLALGPAFAAGDPNTPIIGVWQTGDNSHVTISPCAEDYCGVLTYVSISPAEYARLTPAEKKAADAQDPKHFLDTKNQDAKLRTRSLVKLKMLVLHPTKKPGDFSGTLYNPQDGGTYDGSVHVDSPTQLLLSGCLFKVLCKSQEWTRVK